MSAFTVACLLGDEDEVKSLVMQDPGILNSKGINGLMLSMGVGHHSLGRWLLSLPGIDTNHRSRNGATTLHLAMTLGYPLDIVITLAKLSNWNTVNVNQYQNLTA